MYFGWVYSLSEASSVCMFSITFFTFANSWPFPLVLYDYVSKLVVDLWPLEAVLNSGK
jgi:hypothetical protein